MFNKWKLITRFENVMLNKIWKNFLYLKNSKLCTKSLVLLINFGINNINLKKVLQTARTHRHGLLLIWNKIISINYLIYFDNFESHIYLPVHFKLLHWTTNVCCRFSNKNDQISTSKFLSTESSFQHLLKWWVNNLKTVKLIALR